MNFSKLMVTSGVLYFAVTGIASASTVTFDYTGAAQNWLVPASGVYQIVTDGARGGKSGVNQGQTTFGAGGLGAQVTGTFDLLVGESLRIDVGGSGGEAITNAGTLEGGGGGGGGGTFVATTLFTATLLQVAGGGGGGGSEPANGRPGLSGTAGGGGGGGVAGGDGGTEGRGGGGAFQASGGGGYLSAGGGGTAGPGTGGAAYPTLTGGLPWEAGTDGAGGYGGGGGGGNGGGGGGGGYSGGGAGDSFFGESAGGGGGSYTIGADAVFQPGFNDGNGFVKITFLPGVPAVPEPSTIVLFGLGLLGMTLSARRPVSWTHPAVRLRSTR